jgi:hypothetical protein
MVCQKSVTLDDNIYLKDDGTHWLNPIGAQLSLLSRPKDIFQVLPIVKYVKILDNVLEF